MSLASAVDRAVRIARMNLGDTICIAQYARPTVAHYDTLNGTKESSTVTIDVEYVVDKFSYQELQSGQYQETDIKIVVFNSKNDLTFQVKEFIHMDGVKRPIFKAMPNKIGPYTPVWSLVLRS